MQVRIKTTVFCSAMLAAGMVLTSLQIVHHHGALGIAMAAAAAKDGGKGGKGNNGGGNGDNGKGGDGNNGGGGNSAGSKGDGGKHGTGAGADAGGSSKSIGQVDAGSRGTGMRVQHSNGMSETVQGGRYTMKDARGRTIISRNAQPADQARLRSLLH